MTDGSAKIRLLKKLDVTDLAGEKVMIDYESGKYFILVGSANDIWDLMEDGISTGEIVEHLLRIYEVDVDVCRDCTDDFLQKLTDLGFISLESHA